MFENEKNLDHPVVDLHECKTQIKSTKIIFLFVLKMGFNELLNNNITLFSLTRNFFPEFLFFISFHLYFSVHVHNNFSSECEFTQIKWDEDRVIVVKCDCWNN